MLGVLGRTVFFRFKKSCQSACQIFNFGLPNEQSEATSLPMTYRMPSSA